ncbi:hypothetical protein SASPL_114388 [Salvia splendens]|uniref:Uncharacterized protein n=1 Tax=Salvia splendens TaxID=180675 RepID=A0A8X8Y3A0_SALSN|nr:hypothetical protein SASPL_114388 [Salvia splendens]
MQRQWSLRRERAISDDLQQRKEHVRKSLKGTARDAEDNSNTIVRNTYWNVHGFVEFREYEPTDSELPTQELIARDTHGNEWQFKHIFRDYIKKSIHLGLVAGMEIVALRA